MLVLSRKPSEAVIVKMPDGREMKFTIIKIDRNKARIGFEAPADVYLFREELGGWAKSEETAK